MTQTIVSVVLFLIVLAMLPLAVRWVQQRAPRSSLMGASSRIVSVLAVGPQQRIITVEAGPEEARVWLVLGVTAQNITCLHTLPVGSSPADGVSAAEAPSHEPTFSLPSALKSAGGDGA